VGDIKKKKKKKRKIQRISKKDKEKNKRLVCLLIQSFRSFVSVEIRSII